jgi:hypothetical protein
MEKRFPGFKERISTSLLDMDSCKMCVLGQECSSFMNGLRLLGLSSDDSMVKYWDIGNKKVRIAAAHYGFSLVSKGQEEEEEEFDKLTKEWVRQLTEG